MKIETTLTVYEVNGIKENKSNIKIRNHLLYNHQIVLCLEENTMTIDAKELIKAIENATNHGN
jgi:hypothetical protein